MWLVYWPEIHTNCRLCVSLLDRIVDWLEHLIMVSWGYFECILTKGRRCCARKRGLIALSSLTVYYLFFRNRQRVRENVMWPCVSRADIWKPDTMDTSSYHAYFSLHWRNSSPPVVLQPAFATRLLFGTSELERTERSQLALDMASCTCNFMCGAIQNRPGDQEICPFIAWWMKKEALISPCVQDCTVYITDHSRLGHVTRFDGVMIYTEPALEYHSGQIWLAYHAESNTLR
jgi:hypothetical protein